MDIEIKTPEQCQRVKKWITTFQEEIRNFVFGEDAEKPETAYVVQQYQAMVADLQAAVEAWEYNYGTTPD